ncbi:Phage integrase SAM-like domain-containing protein [Chitinophaga filiformis]|uniref:Phage integrase SAM-like domain-containing protein n=1 Tax=Chitinophaga filiformis TaxID=104663 RepID=A0A1G7SN05_CHIFI|nr:Phage integrase SAM-like domain-containing protein [Chitinophaga filiformis]
MPAPGSQTEKKFNKEALALLETKKAERTLDALAIGSAYIPSHKLKKNFFEFSEEYVKTHKTDGNRYLQGSLNHFKEFTGVSTIAPIDITECEISIKQGVAGPILSVPR